MSTLRYRDRGNQLALPSAIALLGNEPRGAAFDFINMQAYVRDRVTPANNFLGDPNALLTYTSPASKTVFDATGACVAGTTLRCDRDPVAGTLLGIRCERQATNLLFNSMLLGGVDGVPGTAPTGWATLSGGGTLTFFPSLLAGAQKMRMEVASARHIMGRTISVAASTTYVFSVIMTAEKSISCNQVMTLTSPPAGAAITYTVDGASGTGSLTVPVGTHLVSAIMVVGVTAGTVSVRLGVGTSNTASGAVTFDLPQFEANPFRSSYIPTTNASTVTRASDAISKILTSLPFDGVEWSMLCIGRTLATNPDNVFLTLDNNGSTANRSQFYNASGAAIQMLIVSGGTTYASITRTATMSSRLRFAGRIKLDDFGIVANGSAVGGDSGGVVPTVTHMHFGSRSFGVVALDGWLEAAVIVPRGWSNAELQTRAA